MTYAARTHRIIRICERQGVPVLADRAYIGGRLMGDHADQTSSAPGLTATQWTINRALSAARAPVERSVARLKSWRVFRRARCSPNRMTVMAAAVLTLERQR
ncbi:transposase family protein [Streptomyces virginiae]|uniref:transposase family protein n=1 Tax=Streptomyces virginiae TaxID=1961 RepID=UPI003421C90A